MNWDDLRIFHAVAKAGSLSAAAAAIGLSQPTLGRRINVLERELGARLFRRHGRGYALTDIGRQLLEPTGDIERLATDIQRRARGAQPSVAGDLRVSVAHGLGVEWLIPRLPSLRSEHPTLQVSLATEAISADLDRMAADVAIRSFRPSGPRLVARRAATYANGLYAAPSYLEHVGSVRRVADLSRADWVSFESDMDRVPEAQWLEARTRRAPTIRTNNMVAQKAAILAGLGVGVLPTFMVGTESQLKRLLVRASVPTRTIWLVYHEDLRGADRVRAFVDFLVREFESDREAFS